MSGIRAEREREKERERERELIGEIVEIKKICVLLLCTHSWVLNGKQNYANGKFKIITYYSHSYFFIIFIFPGIHFAALGE